VTHQPAAPFKHTSGPRDAKVVLVGEAWGAQEELTGSPFVGAAGQELTRLLKESGLTRGQCLLTNVLALRPPNNDLDAISASKTEVGGKAYVHAPLRQGKYLRPEFLGEVDRLREELVAHPRNLVIALGNTACWALLGSGRISSIRGSFTMSSLVPNLKVLPTYHPSAVLRNWAYRPIVLADLMKAHRDSGFPEIRRPERYVIVNPDLAQIAEWAQRPATHYAVDIETCARQITMIGFARSRADAIVIPFWGQERGQSHYWQTPEMEVQAWKLVNSLLESEKRKIFQNGLFDLQYILKMGLKPKNCIEDTMLLHHSLFPEMPKGLGFLGSVYTVESPWKLMRHSESMKADE